MKYTIWDSEDFKFKVEIIQKQPFLHLEVTKWGLDQAKLLDKLFDSAKALLYLGGARQVFSILSKKEEQIIRFNKMYGMKYIKDIGKEHILMGCNLHEPQKG